MTQVKMSPLLRRLIEDMRIRGMGDKAQKSHIRAIKGFRKLPLGLLPDTTTPEDLRADQLHMSGTGVTPSTFNTRIVALRFFFGMTCGREEMKRYMQFRTEPRKLPVVFSVEEVSDILMAAPGPGAASIVLRSAFPMGLDLGQPRSATSRSATSTATGC